MGKNSVILVPWISTLNVRVLKIQRKGVRRVSRNGNELNDRKKMILKAIIEAHVKEGEPVGSKYLTQNNQISLSPATIRNEMAELESLGYLEQPHASAGRVPSEVGYRFYVNSLMQKYRMSQNELARMNAIAKSRLSEIDRLLETATGLAATLTNYTSIAIKPKQSTAVVDKFKTVLLSPNQFMLIMIDGSGSIRTSQIHTSEPIDEGILSKLEMALNVRVANRSVDEITVSLVMEIERGFGAGESIVSPAIKAVCEVLGEPENGDLKMSGVNHLLEYPEFSDAKEFKELLGALEEKRDILKLVSDADSDGPQVLIGSENSLEEFKNSTMVFQKIKIGEKVVGAIGIIGPRRMDYSKVISTVEYIAQNISGMLNTTPSLPEGDGQTEHQRKDI